jgi:hypothetical protein
LFSNALGSLVAAANRFYIANGVLGGMHFARAARNPNAAMK